MKNAPLDPASLKILAELQKNGRVSSNELAEKIGMSASPCWRRQKELEENGYIVRYTALLDRRKLGLASEEGDDAVEGGGEVQRGEFGARRPCPCLVLSARSETPRDRSAALRTA